MKRAGLACGLVLLTACPTPAAKPEAQVRGAEWLERRLAEGVPEDYTELTLLALVRNGRAVSPVVRRSLEKMLTLNPSMLFRWGLRAMVLAKLDPARYHTELVRCATVLLNNQQKRGCWNFDRVVGPFDGHEPLRQTVVPEDTLGRNCVAHVGGLGLLACRKAGVRVEDDWLDRACAHWRKEQNADGGWGCCGARNSTGSMTAAALTFVRDERGMRWLKEHLTFDENPGIGSRWTFYWYWSLAELSSEIRDPELTAAVSRLRQHLTVTYPWTAELDPIVDTAFALLVLAQ